SRIKLKMTGKPFNSAISTSTMAFSNLELAMERPRRISVFSTLLSIVAFLIAAPANAQVLKAVKERGSPNCGVSEGLWRLSARDNDGNWSGFDVDVCRAIAAAIFNDVIKVSYTPLDANRRFETLRSGSIDVLSRNTTWTMSREVELGLTFAGTAYYD